MSSLERKDNRKARGHREGHGAIAASWRGLEEPRWLASSGAFVREFGLVDDARQEWI